MLVYQSFGEPTEQPTLVIAHGLFGSGRNWRAIARNLSSKQKVITVDMRNHGDSFWDNDNSYAAMAGDLEAVIDEIASPVNLLGHSMGGKAAMVASVNRPEIVNKLLIIDIAPVAYTHSQISNVEIMKALPIQSVATRSQADKLLSNDISDPALRAFFLQSLIIDENGNSWQLNLDVLHANMPTIVGFPNLAGQFTGDSLFLRGGKSNYVKDSDISKIETHFPNFKLQTIDGAGHWVHAEKTRIFLEEIDAFLS